MKRLLLVTAVIALLCVGVAANAAFVFDRGLPTAGLNTPVIDTGASSSRSNVRWAETGPLGWFLGDNFHIAGTGQTAVSDLTVWVAGAQAGANAYDTFTLWTGSAGSTGVSATRTSSMGDANLAWTSVTYSNSSIYQDVNGSSAIYALTFKNLAWTVDNGANYRFGVSAVDSGGNFLRVYLHGSNAARSGSFQEGADGIFYGFNNGVYDYTVASIDPNLWGKPSDINVQISGTQVPEPMSIFLGIMGLSSIAGFRKLRRK